MKTIKLLIDIAKVLVLTHLGRYVLSVILLLSGIFSQNGTLPTGWVLFDYTWILGAVIMIGQSLFLFGVVIYFWFKGLWQKYVNKK